jgi:hypothetical protein
MSVVQSLVHGLSPFFNGAGFPNPSSGAKPWKGFDAGAFGQSAHADRFPARPCDHIATVSPGGGMDALIRDLELKFLSV